MDGDHHWRTGGYCQCTLVMDSFNKVVRPPRKSRRDSQGGAAKAAVDAAESEYQVKGKKFQQEVKEAERSCLIFKANMGDVPIMNPKTMKKKFAMEMVARVAQG
jgi:hypothetical protein